MGATAEIIAKQFPSAERVAVDNLGEMRYGRLEGRKIKDSIHDMAALTKLWQEVKTTKRVCDAGGESPEEVATRTTLALSSLLQQREGQLVLLVSHSWTIKTLLAAVTPAVGMQRCMGVPQRNCAVNILDFSCVEAASANMCSDAHRLFNVLAVDLLAGGHVAT